jgi:CII-binding regulator of phage lambda lysogenization HflD
VSGRDTTVAAYAVVVAAAVAVQALALTGRVDVPSLGRVLTWALRRRSTQIGLVFAWWWLGWHFVTAR